MISIYKYEFIGRARVNLVLFLGHLGTGHFCPLTLMASFPYIIEKWLINFKIFIIISALWKIWRDINT